MKPELSITEIIRNNFRRMKVDEWNWLLCECGYDPLGAANETYCVACLAYGEDW